VETTFLFSPLWWRFYFFLSSLFAMQFSQASHCHSFFPPFFLFEVNCYFVSPLLFSSLSILPGPALLFPFLFAKLDEAGANDTTNKLVSLISLFLPLFPLFRVGAMAYSLFSLSFFSPSPSKHDSFPFSSPSTSSVH